MADNLLRRIIDDVNILVDWQERTKGRRVVRVELTQVQFICTLAPVYEGEWQDISMDITDLMAAHRREHGNAG